MLNQTVPYAVPGIASVVVSVVDGHVSIGSVAPGAGWSIDEHYSTGVEAKVRFVDADGNRFRIDAEIDDGLLRIRTRDERADDRVETEGNFDDGSQVGETIVEDESADTDDSSDDPDDPDDPDDADDNSGSGSSGG